jgi:serine/threonine protein kinase
LTGGLLELVDEAVCVLAPFFKAKSVKQKSRARGSMDWKIDGLENCHADPARVDWPPVLESTSRLGSYQIERLLGAGGMGEVYLARETKLGRRVAVKVLPEAFVLDPERVARFDREAKLLASLNHPNIATL